MSLVGKALVPKTLAGRATGRRTMQDDDALAYITPVPPAANMVAEDGTLIVDESAVQIITE